MNDTAKGAELSFRGSALNADAGNLTGLEKVPIPVGPNNEEIVFIRRDGHALRMVHRQYLACGKMNLKRPEGRPVPHLFDVVEFHQFASDKPNLQAVKFKVHFPKPVSQSGTLVLDSWRAAQAVLEPKPPDHG